jgi:hypothetical protein
VRREKSRSSRNFRIFSPKVRVFTVSAYIVTYVFPARMFAGAPPNRASPKTKHLRKESPRSRRGSPRSATYTKAFKLLSHGTR